MVAAAANAAFAAEAASDASVCTLSSVATVDISAQVRLPTDESPRLHDWVLL